jgi:putative FmdB family regulatory protein
MPIYEFRCNSCRKKTTALVLVRSRTDQVRCQHCGGSALTKLVSRFATPLSEEVRMDRLSDPTSFAGVDENDPKSVSQWLKKMGREMGEDVGEDFDQAIEEEMGGGADGPSDGGDDD